MQQVTITIEAGVPTVSVQGVKGKVCKDVTKAVVAALGGEIESKPTKEMYEQAKQATKASY